MKVLNGVTGDSSCSAGQQLQGSLKGKDQTLVMSVLYCSLLPSADSSPVANATLASVCTAHYRPVISNSASLVYKTKT